MTNHVALRLLVTLRSMLNVQIKAFQMPTNSYTSQCDKQSSFMIACFLQPALFTLFTDKYVSERERNG